MQKTQKPWQVQVQGQVYEADLEELRQWIVEGSVVPSDNVRRGDLRWLTAEKVPAIYDFFIADDIDRAASPAISGDDLSLALKLSDGQAFSIVRNDSDEPSGVFSGERQFAGGGIIAIGGGIERDANFCYRHENSPTEYACDICENFFCKTCPKSFGGSVKLCPLCGSMCRKIDEAVDFRKAVGAIHKPYTQTDETDAENQFPTQNRPQIPGFWKSLGDASRYYKNLLRQSLVDRFFSADAKSDK
ncbi:MAG TPA: hypothetical protein VNI84_13310 [Pyrinomonadaceae bacterium]|nr:hypothetical protein [Pyrinomonadaceae bacterium]